MFEEWAIIELMGHRKVAGKVTEENIGGASFIRTDIYVTGDEVKITQYYNPTAVYSITPVTKETAVKYAARNIETPICKWDLLPEISGDDENEM